jgi:uncharacterized protein (TIGR00369 family)
MFDRSPFTKAQRLSFKSASRGRARIALTVSPGHTQGLARVHGGVVTALADTAATFAGYSIAGADEHLLTTTLSMAFMAGATRGDRLVADARVLHAGRTTIVAEVSVIHGRRPPMAAGTFTMIRMAGGRRLR